MSLGPTGGALEDLAWREWRSSWLVPIGQGFVRLAVMVCRWRMMAYVGWRLDRSLAHGGIEVLKAVPDVCGPPSGPHHPTMMHSIPVFSLPPDAAPVSQIPCSSGHIFRIRMALESSTTE